MSVKDNEQSSSSSINKPLNKINRGPLSVANRPRPQGYKWHSLFVYRMKVFLHVVAVFLVLLIFVKGVPSGITIFEEILNFLAIKAKP